MVASKMNAWPPPASLGAPTMTKLPLISTDQPCSPTGSAASKTSGLGGVAIEGVGCNVRAKIPTLRMNNGRRIRLISHSFQVVPV